jgi:hypothetical protein
MSDATGPTGRGRGLRARAGEVRAVPRVVAAALPRWGFLRAIGGKFGVFLLALTAVILLMPVLAEDDGLVALGALLGTAVLLSGLHAASPGRGSLAVGLVLSATDLLLGRLALALDHRGLLALQSTLWLLTLLYVAGAILEAVFESKHVEVRTLQAALCVYLLIGIIGAFAYTLVELIGPGSFTHLDGSRISWADGANVRSFMGFFSLSFAALSGVGESSFLPAVNFAVNALSLQAMIGQIYLAVVIARLVGIESSAAIQQASDHGGPGSAEPPSPGHQ